MDILHYLEIRNDLKTESFLLGSMEVRIFKPYEINAEQVGYSRTGSGENLVGTNDGDWKTSWLVVGREDLMGEPIFIDLDDEKLPVYTAAHGMERWSPEKLSSSFKGFVEALKEVDSIGHNRRNPTALERTRFHRKSESK